MIYRLQILEIACTVRVVQTVPAAWPDVSGALATMRAIVAARSARRVLFPFIDGSYR